MSTHKITTEQEAFTGALDHLANDTKRKHLKNLGLFLNWLEQENMSAPQARAADILAFIETLRNKHSAEQLSRMAHSIRTWYTFKSYRRNPALGIKVRYKRSGVPHDLLDREALDKLYYEHESISTLGYRDKVVLGLLVFQGLSRGDLERLKVSHLQLAGGKIHIPEGRQINSRVLPLEACQILEMKTYLDDIRPQFKKAADRLIVSREGASVKNILSQLFKALRTRYPSIKHAPQVRQSVITEWLKEKDVRIVQYMAGHKSVNSTERYQAVNLEDLQEQLNKYHPLG